MLHKLKSNRGNILFVIILFTVVLIVGASLLPLLLTSANRQKSETDSLYDTYTYTSYSKILARQVVDSLDDVTVATYYSPLYSAEESQAKLYSSLTANYTDSAGNWIYKVGLPTTVTNKKVNYYCTLTGAFTPSYVEDIKTSNMLQCSNFDITIRTGNILYRAQIENLQLNFNFTNDRLTCHFDTTNAKIINEYISKENIYVQNTF